MDIKHPCNILKIRNGLWRVDSVNKGPANRAKEKIYVSKRLRWTHEVEN